MTVKTRAERRAEREPTAAEKLAALEERRRANKDGLLVPKPVLASVEDFMAWLRAVAEVGSAGDVELAWHQVDNVPWKERLRNEYERLGGIAGQRYAALETQAAEDKHKAEAERQARAAFDTRKKEAAALKARLAEIEAQG